MFSFKGVVCFGMIFCFAFCASVSLAQENDVVQIDQLQKQIIELND